MTAPLVLAGGGFAVLAALAITIQVLRARRLEVRLRSLVIPLHELRGALSALSLGLTVVERTAGPSAELSGSIDSLRLSLGRASLATQDIEALRVGERTAAVLGAPIDMSALVLRTARAWSQLAAGYGARLEVDWRAGPVHVCGDAARLRTALDNLIANALEHGGRDVLVEAELRGTFLRLTLSDTGRGLPKSLDELCGERPSRARGHGLAIARDVILDHHGRLTVGSGRNGPALVLELPTHQELEKAAHRLRPADEVTRSRSTQAA
jgi:two-component system OmpR family sensor kinase